LINNFESVYFKALLFYNHKCEYNK